MDLDSTPASTWIDDGTGNSGSASIDQLHLAQYQNLHQTRARVSTNQSEVGSISSNTIGSRSGLLFINWLRLKRRLYCTKTRSFNRFFYKQFLFFMWIRSKTDNFALTPRRTAWLTKDSNCKHLQLNAFPTKWLPPSCCKCKWS